MVENSPVVVSWRGNKPERVRSHSRAFRNPPQPHMCIQDFLEGSQEPCYINVMSWDKIALPLGPEDSIPLYGGMQVPHTPPSLSPVFAVMANPEVLRAKGKNAADPQETHALVLMMLDFVELMNRNRGLHFARHFRVLPDRDLAGELKNVWAAVQMKRAHDTATRASLQQLVLQQQQQQEQQRQHQIQQQEEQLQRYRRQQQQLYKEKQAMIQKEQRYRHQQQQQEEIQRMMDEAEMEKYLEQRHHQRLLHEQQRQDLKHQSHDMDNIENGSIVTQEDPSDNITAIDYSTDKTRMKDSKLNGDGVNKNGSVCGIEVRPSIIHLDSPSTSTPVISLKSPSGRWIDGCSMKYREQEYLSTSASESDCTDDGDATDAETELDRDLEPDNDKGQVLARVTLTLDSPGDTIDKSEDKGGPSGGGDASTLKNKDTE